MSSPPAAIIFYVLQELLMEQTGTPPAFWVDESICPVDTLFRPLWPGLPVYPDEAEHELDAMVQESVLNKKLATLRKKGKTDQRRSEMLEGVASRRALLEQQAASGADKEDIMEEVNESAAAVGVMRGNDVASDDERDEPQSRPLLSFPLRIQ